MKIHCYSQRTLLEANSKIFMKILLCHCVGRESYGTTLETVLEKKKECYLLLRATENLFSSFSICYTQVSYLRKERKIFS